jgi:predicted transcriptional regulator
MEIQLSVEQEEQLSQIAALTGRSVVELVDETINRLLGEEANFRARVQDGIEAADRGEFLTSSEVWARVERVLQS